MRTIEGIGGVSTGGESRAAHRSVVALAGSRGLQHLPESVLEWLTTLDCVVLLRRGMKSNPGLFERAMAAFCKAQGIDYEWCMPDPLGGREATYLRDVAMTRRADLVLAFFPAAMMSGGTEHVVEKALDAGTPVYSWGQMGDGSFARIGEHDPDGVWEGRLPVI